MISLFTNGSASQRYRGDAARPISHHLTLTLSWKEREPWPKTSRRSKKRNASSTEDGPRTCGPCCEVRVRCLSCFEVQARAPASPKPALNPRKCAKFARGFGLRAITKIGTPQTVVARGQANR